MNNKRRLRPIKSPIIPSIVPANGLTRYAIENIKTVKKALIVGLVICAKNVAEISLEKIIYKTKS
ncbi:hypothetical protein FNFX1_1222 [Francisella cf. novicida Fx1]|nr:hypothetical protein FNFX1_1222 [Francisella cf. novicida Fx1]